MKTCKTCGKKIRNHQGKCSSCEEYPPLEPSTQETGSEKIKTINLKQGLPLVDEGALGP